MQEYPEVSYNTTLTEVPFYMYKPHSNEAKRYEFKGWITADDFLSGNSNPQIISDFTITSDLSLYAYYKE